MMRPRALVAFLLLACLAAPLAERASDSAPPAPVGSVELKDGRVLHNVSVVSNEADSIVVRADEGLVKVDKSDLPKALAGAYPAKAAAPSGPELVMVTFDPNQVVKAPVEEPGAKPTPRPTRVPTPGRSPVYKGCSIISFQVKAFQSLLGCVEVVVRNDTDAAVEIRPGDFVCVTTAGARLAGRNIATDGFPPRAKRRELIPPHGEVDDIVTFANDALDMASVQWAR